LQSLKACLAMEENSSPIRLIHGCNISTRKTIQFLLTRHESPTPGMPTRAPMEREGSTHHLPGEEDTLIPINAVMAMVTGEHPDYTAIPRAGIFRNRTTPCAGECSKPAGHCRQGVITSWRPMGQSGAAASRAKEEGDSSEEEWQSVHNVRITQEMAPSSGPCSHPYGDSFSSLRALVRLITKVTQEKEDIVYETTPSPQGYLGHVSLRCLDDLSISGSHCKLEQDAILSAAQAAISMLAGNCQIRMAPPPQDPSSASHRVGWTTVNHSTSRAKRGSAINRASEQEQRLGNCPD
jgi:hypothetical protein